MIGLRRINNNIIKLRDEGMRNEELGFTYINNKYINHNKFITMIHSIVIPNSRGPGGPKCKLNNFFTS